VAWQTAQVAPAYDLLAPDGSEIRLLLRVGGGSMVHCRLRPGQVTQAVRHRTVEEVWFCVGGAGQIWRRDADAEDVTDLEPGVSVSIPRGTAFQFRATGDEPLDVLITTMPPWPGPDEAVVVDGTWPSTSAGNPGAA
jgi:mannose-6-phosphate isomerase-like protein (cupin superfamily)